MLNYNDDDDVNFAPQTEQDRLISKAKLVAFVEMQKWIENVTNQRFSHNEDFRRSLSNGCLLCNLLNCLKPGSIKRINKISTPIAGYDNIGKFLRACEEDFGLSNVILFETSDLEDLSDKSTDMTMESDRRLQRVLICLFHLAKSVENQLTKVTLDQKPFSIMLQSQDHKEMRRLKSNSISSDASHDIYLSKIMHNQRPNYLANKAQETVNSTKKNQEVLHRTVNDEEWQESLQNWREKRRQVISNPTLDDNKDERNGDHNELLELKERARKMKLLRDQLKDQSNIPLPPPVTQSANGDNQNIPDIDDETKAMIERVKQKKLDEENKRKFNISPPPSAGFGSDSEQSTSTAVDKYDNDDTMSTSEKHKIAEEPAKTPEMVLNSICKNNSTNQISTKCQEESERKEVKTRLVNVKLIRRSKQDCDRLWGMDIVKGPNGVIVSKVKIGSCADICDVRKGDEIITINAENVSNKSFEYVQSLFEKYESVISSSDSVILYLRRICQHDEDDEFFSSDESEGNYKIITHVDPNSEVLHGHDISYLRSDLETSDVFDFKDNRHKVNEKICPIEMFDTSEIPRQSQQPQSAIESFIRYKEDFFSPLATNNSIINGEVSNTEAEADSEVNHLHKLSVHDKISKIESQTVSNTIRLSSSWNLPKTSFNDPFFSKSSKCIGQSMDRLCWNSENSKYRQFGSGNSSISNLYHYWETEAPKSVSSTFTNKVTKSAPMIQTPIRSMIDDKDLSNDIELEIAEQQFDTSNGNLVQTWKNVHSSGNSSTSDDVSALNETTQIHQNILPSELKLQTVDLEFQGLSAVEYARSSSCGSLADHNLGYQIDSQFISTAPVMADRVTSTGIQADLLQCRKPTNYTTITTAFTTRCKESNYPPSLQLSDDDTCSITVSNNHCPSTPELRESTCRDYAAIVIANTNDISKDYTTITAVTQHNENPRKIGAFTSLSTQSSITGLSDDNEKSVEIEVSVAPQLFPIKHKSLLSKNMDDRFQNPRSNDLSTFSNSFCAEEVTFPSEYIKVTDLDDIISPIKKDPHRKEMSTGNEVYRESNRMPDQQSNGVRPFVKMRKKELKSNSLENGKRSNSETASYADKKSNSMLTTIDTEPSLSTVPVPTLFKGGPKSDNTISQGQISSRSESVKSKKLESILTSKKLKKSSPADNSTLSESKRSSSTKELRFEGLPNEKDGNRESPDSNKRPLSYSGEPKHSSSTTAKYSLLEPSQPKSISNLPSTTTIKSHTKTFSIERSTKQSANTIVDSTKKLPKKTQASIVNETKTTMKCNYCAAFVGLEDLMVIEELKLHFHLRCFICSECMNPLGDGKSDTDVRIRRSKLHCMDCYNKKSSKSKHRLGSTVSRMSAPMGNISQNKETEI